MNSPKKPVSPGCASPTGCSGPTRSWFKRSVHRPPAASLWGPWSPTPTHVTQSCWPERSRHSMDDAKSALSRSSRVSRKKRRRVRLGAPRHRQPDLKCVGPFNRLSVSISHRVTSIQQKSFDVCIKSSRATRVGRVV